MQLQPCPECGRHVVVETACPFCASGVAATARGASTPLGRMSRAMVFAGATVAIGPACGGKAKPATADGTYEMNAPRERGTGGCMDPDPAELARLEKQKAAAETDEEKAQIDQQIADARQPVCMPYGAPPRRRRMV